MDGVEVLNLEAALRRHDFRNHEAVAAIRHMFETEQA